MKLLAISLASALLACASAPKSQGLASLRVACDDGAGWNGTSCVPLGKAPEAIAKGQAELDQGLFDAAIASFKSAAALGPHSHSVHVQIFEQLGIAHGFKEETEQAISAFSKLLLLAPNHLLSYNESPKATLKFETAREAAAKKPGPSIDVRWPVDNEVSREIPVEVEVVSDPTKMLSGASLLVRDLEGGPTHAVDIELAPVGERREIRLPRLGGTEARTLAIHLVARDKSGSEVLLWASAESPRRIPVDYTPPTPLLKKWWFWAAVGGVVAVGAGTTAYFLFREPPDLVDGLFNP